LRRPQGRSRRHSSRSDEAGIIPAKPGLKRHRRLINTRRRLIRLIEIGAGSLDMVFVHPRDVFKPVIVFNAAALVLVHNHPSGDPSPSEADIRMTRDIIRAGQLLKIEVLDHLILGQRTAERPRDFVSLKELGFFA
jgi:DNA repair protein RadC